MGRPTKYDPDMCGVLVECGRRGYSKAEMAAELDVTRETLDIWARQHPDFSDALQRAQELSLAWWEAQSRQGLANREFNAGLWGKAMSGRFPKEPYRDRQEHTGADGQPVQHALTVRFE